MGMDGHFCDTRERVSSSVLIFFRRLDFPVLLLFFGLSVPSPPTPIHLHTYIRLPQLLLLSQSSFFLSFLLSFSVLRFPSVLCFSSLLHRTTRSGSSATNGRKQHAGFVPRGNKQPVTRTRLQAITLVSGPPPRYTDVTARRHRSPPEPDSLGPNPISLAIILLETRRDETRLREPSLFT